MEKILISACLMGQPVRYNGSAKTLIHPALERWKAEGRLVVICPEMAGGFNTPRPPAEIANGNSGDDVLSGTAHVVDMAGTDVTEMFLSGARTTLSLALANDCRYALLINGSPSCGSGFIYDGNFSGGKHAGAGVTASLLRANGVEVFAPSQIAILQQRLSGNSATAATEG
ncbi:MAG: DUF523 domain-containing protein [Phyllobacterium sp.]